LKAALQKLSPESLKNYDGVVFASTTGDLPLPDPQGFLDWIKAGHAFIGIHAATDTFHHWPAYIDMLGGEFMHHGKQVSVDCLNQDPQNPATAMLPKVWTISQEEIYQFQNYDPAKVHDLLILDKHPESGAPGHYGVCWCKMYGTGRVFYTSLGHREDVWDTDPDMKDRKNSPEISKAYQAHVLGGIEWALGLKGSAVTP
jgi:type 1 glutamine amidotransferase